jgi:hypothetical protein
LSLSALAANAPVRPVRDRRGRAGYVKLSPLHALLLALFAALASINNYPVWAVTMAGQAVVGVILGYAALLLLSRWLAGGRWQRALYPVAIWAALFIGVYCAGFVVQGSLKGFRYSVLSAVFYIVLFAMLACVRYTVSGMLALGWCFGLVNAGLGVWWLWLGAPSAFAAHMTNPNLSAGYFGFSLFFILLALHAPQPRLGRLPLIAAAGLTVGLAWISESRAIMLALTVLAAVYYGWPWLAARRGRYITAFWVVVALAVVITAVLPVIGLLPFFDELTHLSEQLFHKSISSGRSWIWALVFQGILEAPLFGHGPYYLPRNLFDIELSAHNLYLQVALQVGLAGLAALLGTLQAIWRVFWHGRHDRRVRLAAGFTAAILVHQTFDVSLTQHNLSLGLLMWMIMGIGAGLALNSPRTARAPAAEAGEGVA